MPRKIKKKLCQCGTTSKGQMDMILFEIRQNRKDILELKEFMNKSKGTVGLIVLLATIIATVFGAVNYLKWQFLTQWLGLDNFGLTEAKKLSGGLLVSLL